VDGFFKYATYKDLNEPEEITDWLNKAVEGNCEVTPSTAAISPFLFSSK